LIVTSPPYFGQRDYRDGGQSLAGQIGSEETPAEYIAALLRCTREWMRVLKPSGSLFVNLGDKYSQRVAIRPSSHQDGLFPGRPELRKDWKRDRAAGLTRMPYQNIIGDDCAYVQEKSLMGLPWRYALRCMDELGLINRRDNIWHKTSGLPESVDDRCATRHEYVFHFTREPRYFSAIDEIREPQQSLGERHNGRSGWVGAPKGIARGFQERALSPLGKLPGSVWEIPAAPLIVPEHISHAGCCGGRKRDGCEDGLGHYAAFPPALAKKAILGWSPSGICTECGEGRRPASERASCGDFGPRIVGRNGQRQGIGPSGNGLNVQPTAITGYVCACTPYIDHPGTGRSHKRTGNTMLDGEGWASTNELAGSYQNYERVGSWREYHFDRWTPAPTRPALVVDPFAGTGTTMLTAAALGRIGVGIDRSMDYARLAVWRCNDPGERARALGVPKPPPVPEGQLAFDLAAMEDAS
jgi:DNA modification methylase